MANSCGNNDTDIREKLEQMDVSPDEMNKLTEAFKQPEFKQLFDDYLREISDPHVRAENDAYLRQLEAEYRSSDQSANANASSNNRGASATGVDPAKLVVPSSWLCIQTVSDSSVVYVNLCTSDKLECMELGSEDGRAKLQVPYSVGRAASLPDGSTSVDVAVSDDTKTQSISDSRIRDAVLGTALDAAAHRLQLELDTQSYTVLESSTYHGPSDKPHVQTLQSQPGTRAAKDTSTSALEHGSASGERSIGRSSFNFSKSSSSSTTTVGDNTSNASSTAQRSGPFEPRFRIVERGYSDFADGWQDKRITTNASYSTAATPSGELVAYVDMPNANHVQELEVDASERRLKLQLQNLYSLDTLLPRTVDESQCKARWNSKRKQLEVRMPLVHQEMPEQSDAQNVEENEVKEEEEEGGGNAIQQGTREEDKRKEEQSTMHDESGPAEQAAGVNAEREADAQNAAVHTEGIDWKHQNGSTILETENQRRWRQIHGQSQQVHHRSDKDNDDDVDDDDDESHRRSEAKATLAPRTIRPPNELELD